MADNRADGNDSDRRGRAGGSGAADAAATAATAPGPERRFSSCSVAAARPIRTVIVIFTVVVFFTDDVFLFINSGGGSGGGAVVVVVDVRRSHGRPNGSRPWQSKAAAAASRQPSRGRPSRSCSAFGGAHFELACRDTPTGEMFTV